MWLLEAHPSFNYALVQSYHTRVIKFLRSELLLIFCAVPRGCPGRAWKGSSAPRACRVRGGRGRGGARGWGAAPSPHDLGSAGNLFLRLVYSFIRCWFNGESSPPPFPFPFNPIGICVRHVRTQDNHLPGRFVTSPDVIGELFSLFFFFFFKPS